MIEAAGAYPDGIRRAVDALGHLPRGEVVEDIFIRMEPRVPLAVFRHLGSRVTPVFSWFQAAAILYTRGRVDAEGLGAVALACRRAPHAWAGWLVDLVRRSLLTAEQAERAVQATVVLEPASDAMRRSIARLGQPAPPDAQLHRDYLGFLRSARGRRVS